MTAYGPLPPRIVVINARIVVINGNDNNVGRKTVVIIIVLT